MIYPVDTEKIIAIPDIHGMPFWKKALTFISNGHLVFLGDYLDPYENEEGITNEEAFYNLLDIVELKRQNPKRVTLLWGNHDLHYLYRNLQGSRYDYANSVRFNQFFWQNKDCFQFAEDAEVNGKRYLFSHAGVGRKWAGKVLEKFNNSTPTASELNELSNSHFFIEALCAISGYRGGWSEYGSMVWADYCEQYIEENQYKDIIQVFGHTHMLQPKNINNVAFCIDCYRCFMINPLSGDLEELNSQ